MKAHEALDLSTRPVLLLGNGPSSWDLTDRGVRELREEFPSLFVVGCNRGWALWPLDLVVAADPTQGWELMSLRRFDQQVICFPRKALQQWLMAGRTLPSGFLPGENWVSTDSELGNVSTGTAAFGTVLRCGARIVVLVGFDGSRSPESFFQGTDGYRRKPAAEETHLGWETHMRRIANHERESAGRSFEVVLGLGDDRSHPLDSLPSDRVVLSGRPHKEIAECLRSRRVPRL